MDKEPIMKKCNVIFSATMIAVFSVVAFANEPDLNSNPFLAEHSAQQQGAQVFSLQKRQLNCTNMIKLMQLKIQTIYGLL